MVISFGRALTEFLAVADRPLTAFKPKHGQGYSNDEPRQLVALSDAGPRAVR
jgi:hypothetical protein